MLFFEHPHTGLVVCVCCKGGGGVKEQSPGSNWIDDGGFADSIKCCADIVRAFT